MQTSNQYWDFPNRQQAKALRIVNRYLNSIPEKALAYLKTYDLDQARLMQSEANRLHANIDTWKDKDYWHSIDLAGRASYFRKRQNIMTQDAIELLILALFVQTYYELLQSCWPLYDDIYKEKVEDEDEGLTFLDFFVIPLMSGMTIANKLFNEAIYRAKHVTRILHGDNPEILLNKQIQTATRTLLRPTPKPAEPNPTEPDNWAGILDTTMTLVVAQAEIDKAKRNNAVSYNYHAIMDDRTTPICSALNDCVIPIEKMVMGINFPPATSRLPHPCRSFISWNYTPVEINYPFEVDNFVRNF